MASGSYNTMAEWLGKINQDLASAAACPDADLEFLVGLQTQVLQKLRQPYDQNPNGMPPQLPPAGGMNMGPGMPGAGPPSPGPSLEGIVPAGGPVGPGPAPMASSNPDELRRALSL